MIKFFSHKDKIVGYNPTNLLAKEYKIWLYRNSLIINLA